jgi:hypothetical protein
MTKRTTLILAAVLAIGTMSHRSASAEPLSLQDREEIVRLSAAKGYSGSDINALVDEVNRAGERGVPPEPLANKIKEGLAKGVEPKRIEPVVRQMAGHFESAQGILKDAGTRGFADAASGNRQRAVEALAEAFARGATADDVREFSRVVQEIKQKPPQEAFASGAKSVAVMKEAGISPKDGSALVGEALRQGFRAGELIDLARDIKRRGRDFQEGRLTIQSVREALSRGERSERIFHDSDRSGSGGGHERMERGGGSDRGDRGRDEHGGRSGSERSDRGDRSRSGREGR